MLKEMKKAKLAALAMPKAEQKGKMEADELLKLLGEEEVEEKANEEENMMPEMEVMDMMGKEEGEEEMEAPKAGLEAMSDEELLAELKKRGLMGALEE